MWNFLRRKPEDLEPTTAMGLIGLIIDAQLAISELKTDMRRVQKSAQDRDLDARLLRIENQIRLIHADLDQLKGIR